MPHTIVFENCPKLNVRNVTIYSSNCMGIVVSGGNGAAISVTSARHVIIRRNRMTDLFSEEPDHTGGRFLMDNRSAVFLSNCDRVDLIDNKLVHPGPFMSRPLTLGENVKSVTGKMEP